jgi:Flp pilus assembly protein CpaB
LLRLNGWPRKLAALACLVAAAGSAVAGGHGARANARGTPAAVHHPGGGTGLAVPIRFDAGLASTVRPGQRIDVLAAPSEDAPARARDAPLASVVVRSARVIAVRLPSELTGASDQAVIVVAVPRQDALRLTAFAGSVLVPAVTGYS